MSQIQNISCFQGYLLVLLIIEKKYIKTNKKLIQKTIQKTIQSRGIIAKLLQLRHGIDSQPSGALECVFLNTEQCRRWGTASPSSR